MEHDRYSDQLVPLLLQKYNVIIHINNVNTNENAQDADLTLYKRLHTSIARPQDALFYPEDDPGYESDFDEQEEEENSKLIKLYGFE